MKDLNEHTLRYANLTTRCVALFIDYVLWSALLNLSGTLSTPQLIGPSSEAFTLLNFCLVYSYFWLLPRFGKATLGQYVMGIRVMAARYEKPNYLLRTFLGLISLWFWILILLWRFAGLFQLERQSNILW